MKIFRQQDPSYEATFSRRLFVRPKDKRRTLFTFDGGRRKRVLIKVTGYYLCAQHGYRFI